MLRLGFRRETQKLGVGPIPVENTLFFIFTKKQLSVTKLAYTRTISYSVNLAPFPWAHTSQIGYVMSIIDGIVAEISRPEGNLWLLCWTSYTIDCAREQIKIVGHGSNNMWVTCRVLRGIPSKRDHLYPKSISVAQYKNANARTSHCMQYIHDSLRI